MVASVSSYVFWFNITFLYCLNTGNLVVGMFATHGQPFLSNFQNLSGFIHLTTLENFCSLTPTSVWEVILGSLLFVLGFNRQHKLKPMKIKMTCFLPNFKCLYHKNKNSDLSTFYAYFVPIWNFLKAIPAIWLPYYFKL